MTIPDKEGVPFSVGRDTINGEISSLVPHTPPLWSFPQKPSRELNPLISEIKPSSLSPDPWSLLGLRWVPQGV